MHFDGLKVLHLDDRWGGVDLDAAHDKSVVFRGVDADVSPQEETG